jgi:hypothetical protein
MTMIVDRFDMLWALGFLGSMVLLGADGADVWFLNFGVRLIWWFREPLGDWLGERAARKMGDEVHR